MKSFVITQDVLLAVLNYLSTKPFIEVHGLIAKLQESKEIKESENGDGNSL